MMKRSRKLIPNMIVALLLVAICSVPIRSQESTARGDRPGRTVVTTAGSANLGAMNIEEKLLRDVYTRLMRYQSAAVDEKAAKTGEPSASSNYLTFELRDFHSGDISEIQQQSLSNLVTERSGDIISVNAIRLRHFNGPSHAYYEAVWDTAPAVERQEEHPQESRRFAAFNKYTSYQVTVRLGDKERTYQALAVYQIADWHGTSESRTIPAHVSILDNVTGDMNTVYRDESPRVRVPWSIYVKTGLYRAIAKSIKKKVEAGKPVRPDDAAIGYLPGDDAEMEFAIPIDGDPGDGGGGGGGDPDPDPTTCAAVSITPIKAVGKNYTRTVTVTVEPAAAITLTLATTTGTGSAVFASNNSTTLNVNQTTDVEIKGVTESSTKDNIRLRATRNGSNVGSISFTVIMVTISMRFTGAVSNDNAGKAAYSNILGTSNLGSFKSSGSNPNHIWRNGVEFTAVIKPSNFSAPVILNRIVDAVNSYNNQTLSFNPGPFNDTSDSVLRDDDPQSGGSGGKVYDLDAPALGASASAAVGVILRTRINFHAWATVDVDARVSPDFEWFSRQSITKTASGDQLINDVPNDNMVGTGTTRLTWNLQ